MTEKIKLINVKEDPIVLFNEWFEEAKQKEINDPNAMNLSTISENLMPSSRIVLLKYFDKNGFVFYTNVESKKGNSINFNSQVSLNFHWKSLLRQIRIEGIAKLVTNEEADEYFDSRPKASKIGAWASDQSSELKTREELINKIKEYTEKYKEKNIPRPLYWTGFRVEPLLIEFWQDMPFRLHDRVEYKKNNNSWLIKRLYP